ncbi:MAG TPA: 3D domain-containing protein [Candidatus Acidoferrales bacterium]|nr:3D domain-containing protein [Candidatus Acidoferrales bacterium]
MPSYEPFSAHRLTIDGADATTAAVSPTPSPSSSIPPTCEPYASAGADTLCLVQTITLYDAQSNAPGNQAYVAYGVLHFCGDACLQAGVNPCYPVAGGSGTASDPITFAADPTIFPPGSQVYVPFLSRYFIMEDDCPGCAGSEHMDLWLGIGTTAIMTACATSLSGHQIPIIQHPPPDLPVVTTPLWDGTQCYVPPALPPAPYTPLDQRLRAVRSQPS